MATPVPSMCTAKSGQLVADGAYSVNAEEHVTDVLDELGVEYSEEEEEKLGNKLMNELAYEQFVRIPKEGDSFNFLNTKITVLSMKKSRIYRLKIQILPREDKETEGGTEQ